MRKYYTPIIFSRRYRDNDGRYNVVRAARNDRPENKRKRRTLSGPRRRAGSLGNKYNPIRRVLNRLARLLGDHRLYSIIVHARAFPTLHWKRHRITVNLISVAIRKISINYSWNVSSFHIICNCMKMEKSPIEDSLDAHFEICYFEICYLQLKDIFSFFRFLINSMRVFCS